MTELEQNYINDFDDVIGLPCDEEVLEDDLWWDLMKIHIDLVDESLVPADWKSAAKEWLEYNRYYGGLRYGF